MNLPWQNKTGLAKAAVILATTLIISLGLCGLNIVGVSSLRGTRGLQGPLLVTAYLEALAIILSLFGLFVVGFIAIIRALFGRTTDQ